MSFQEKITWTTLISTVILFGYYFFRIFTDFTGPETQWSDMLGLFIGLLFLILLLQVGSLIAVSVFNYKEAQNGEDERETLIRLKSRTVSHSTLVVGVWGSFFIPMVWEPTLLIFANSLLAFFIVSEITGSIARLIYYRRV